MELDTSFLQQYSTDIKLFLKIVFLVVVFIYGLFSLMLANKIRSFNKILFLPIRSGGNLMQKIAFVYALIIFIFFIVVLIVI